MKTQQATPPEARAESTTSDNVSNGTREEQTGVAEQHHGQSTPIASYWRTTFVFRSCAEIGMDMCFASQTHPGTGPCILPGSLLYRTL
jgi:hypothetical protein